MFCEKVSREKEKAIVTRHFVSLGFIGVKVKGVPVTSSESILHTYKTEKVPQKYDTSSMRHADWTIFSLRKPVAGIFKYDAE